MIAKDVLAVAFVVVVSTALSVPVALGADEYNTSTGTTVAGQGVALRGADVVSLASTLKVEPGHAKFTAVHDGVAYYFATEQAKDQFAAKPEQYLPQFGGFCALGVALGKKLDGSPRFADLVDGELVLFLNAAVFEKYKQDKAGTLAKAKRNWPAMRNRSVVDVNGLRS